MRRRVRIQRHFDGRSLTLHRFAQKRFRRVDIPLPAQKEVHGLARFVDGPVQVNPLAAHLDVSSSIRQEPPTGRAYRFHRFSNSGV